MIAVAPVQSVKFTCSQSKHSSISVELDSHADNCVVGSNVLVVHNHESFVDVYIFDNKTRHTNASMVDAAISSEDPTQQ